MSLSAHHIVSCQTDGWFIMLEGERYGPLVDGQVGALIAAVQAANHAGKDSHDARVLLRAKDGRVSTAWIFGADSYPSPWVEELHRIALLPRRERAHASVPPGPSMTPEAAVAGQA